MDEIQLSKRILLKNGYHFDLDKNIFKDNKLITDFKIPDTIFLDEEEYIITSLADTLFADNPTLKSITLPKYLKAIKPHTFECCKRLENVFTNNDLEIIDTMAFKGCCSLKKIILPENFKILKNFAFASSGLEEIIFTGKNIDFDYCALTNTKLKSITFPQNTKKLPDFILDQNPFLEEIILPKNLETLTTKAFYGDFPRLKTLILPTAFKIEDENFLNYMRTDNLIVYLPANVNKYLKEKLLKRKDIIFKERNIETLIEEGKTFKDINSFFKEAER